METGVYQTISALSEGIYKEKGSKFIGLAYPIQSEEEVKPITEGLRKEHPAAVHFCYAYRIGPSGEKYRANDDGEPGGTAGKPIYNQLLSFDLTNVLLVVVRYYGGTKLGVSGLITAYKEAASEALKAATVEKQQVMDYFRVITGYEQLGEVNRVFRDRNPVIVEKSFSAVCEFMIGLPIDLSGGFEQELLLINDVTVVYVKRG